MKHASFHTITAAPWNGSPEPSRLVEHDLTPRDAFFVRNHGEIPPSAGDAHLIHVDGLCAAPFSVSVGDLQRATPITMRAALQCAGNRRDQVMAVRPIGGELPWASEAIGNAEWGGIPLLELLTRAIPTAAATHVCFTGADLVTSGGGTGHPFGGSIPLADAAQALIALTMNGAPLPPEHGAPVRVVVPGTIAARSVKWLTHIRLSAEPSESYFQRRAYRLGTDAAPGEMLGAVPVNSAILQPAAGAQLAAGRVTLRGWASPSAGHGVTQVECSVDDGSTWQRATLLTVPERDAWVRWECTVELAPGSAALRCRATDTSAHVQPADPATTWNPRGYLNNAWHRVTVETR